MLKHPVQWFFNRLGLGMALANGGAHAPFSRSYLNFQGMEDEMIFRYLGTQHTHEIEQ